MKRLLIILAVLLSATTANAQSMWMPSGTASVMRPIPTWDMGIYDSDHSHLYPFIVSSNATANRNITWDFGDAARTITFSGNPTLNDWFDQSVKAAAAPTFNGLTLTGSIVSTSDGNIVLAPNGTGVMTLSSDLQWPDSKGPVMGDDQDWTQEWDGVNAVSTITSGAYTFMGGDVGINATPRTALEIYNQHTGTADLPGGDSSLYYALALKSDVTQDNSRPGIIQYGLRTAGSAMAYSMQKCYIGSSEANASQAAVIGLYGNVGASTHTSNYMYIDARDNGAYNNATLKVDAADKVGIGLVGDARPAVRLEVNGSIRLPADAQQLQFGAAQDGIIEFDGTSFNIETASDNANIVLAPHGTGNVGIGTTSPDAPLEINAATGGGIRLTYNDANGSATDYATIFTDANGGLQVTTVDSDGAAGNIDIAPDGVTTIGDGGTTNYAQFAADGELTLAGTARVKKEFTVPLSDFAAGASGAKAALQGDFPSYEFTVSDELHTSLEIPSDCDTSGDITVEIYWGIDEAYATGSGEVQWAVNWRTVANVGEDITSGGSSGTIDLGDVNIPASVNLLTKTEGTISAASVSQDDWVSLMITRVALDDGSNPSAEPYIIGINVEYVVDKLGESM